MTQAGHASARRSRWGRMTSLCRAGATALFLVLAALIAFAAAPQGASAQGPTLSVDANTRGNGPTTVGPHNSCISVSKGDRFAIDVVVSDVEDLLAWEVYLEYDATIVEIVERDVSLFQNANSGSAVYDVSEALPDDDGLYRLAAADTADPPQPDSGSGVLTRVTFIAIAPGASTAALARRDLNGDGTMDIGPFLRNADAAPIGDVDGDTLFDGVGASAEIAVDVPCPPDSTGSQPAVETGSGGRGSRIAYIFGAALAAAAVTGLGAFFVLYRRKARTESPQQ